MKKALFVILGLLLSLPLWSEEIPALLKDFKGKVEVQLAGGKWQPAKKGQTLPRNAILSTGFNSVATLGIADNQVVVQPLTRLAVSEILASDKGLTTKLYLRVGAVSADIKSATKKDQDFSVKSPYATASVRGTAFNFDGVNLEVVHGRVAFLPNRPSGESDAGEFSRSASEGSLVGAGSKAKLSDAVLTQDWEGGYDDWYGLLEDGFDFQFGDWYLDEGVFADGDSWWWDDGSWDFSSSIAIQWN